MPRSKSDLVRSRLGAAFVALAILLVTATAGAQTPQDEFTTEITRESLPASPLLFTAYAFVWVAVAGYVFMLWRRLARVERELAEVAAKLGRGRS
jgi:CcmD family protein